MKRILLSLFIAGTATIVISAQSQVPQSFSDFRKEMYEGYNKFRKSILEDYDRFLEAAWGDYEQFRGQDRYEVPKPHKAPEIPMGGDIPKADDKPLSPVKKPAPVPEQKPKPQPEQKPAPTPKPKPAEDSPAVTTLPEAKKSTPVEEVTFPFFGIDYKIAETGVSLSKNLRTSNDFADQWRAFADSDVARMVSEFKNIANNHGFNDFLTYQLIASYVDSRHKTAPISARVALEHFLLVNMGYDVRIAVDNSGTPLLLIPFGQQVYGKPFLMLNGRKYYVFQPEGVELNTNSSISTCKLPADANIGRPMDLRLSALNLPAKMKDFNLSYGGVELHGQLNENLMPILYRYPQMEMGNYAESVISPELRDDLVKQLKSQLSDLSQAEAVDKLLKFTQSAFEYATDGDFHGFEKPYFLEEILYYPKCDCEDRAIFYTYMLWNVLGVPNHLLAYPGHESASVSLDTPIKGSGYEYEGKMYYISDPTYIGASSGMCMPSYVSTKPEIDYSYK